MNDSEMKDLSFSYLINCNILMGFAPLSPNKAYGLGRLDAAGRRSGVPRKGTRDDDLPDQRRLKVLHFLQTQGQATVAELAHRLQVSCATVRRDLDRLACQKLVTRTYGGAIAVEDSALAPSGSGERWHAPEIRIARAAFRLIAEGETLLVNDGLLTSLIASELGQKHLTLITNNLSLPAALPTNLDVYVLGGKYACAAQATIGPVAVFGAGITADSALLRVDGVDAEHGLTMAILEEAWMVLAMMASARRTIVMVSGAKLGNVVLGRVGGLDKMQVLVADKVPPNGLAHALQEARVQVTVVRDC